VVRRVDFIQVKWEVMKVLSRRATPHFKNHLSVKTFANVTVYPQYNNNMIIRKNF
jgi:hypothetical protein